MKRTEDEVVRIGELVTYKDLWRELFDFHAYLLRRNSVDHQYRLGIIFEKLGVTRDNQRIYDTIMALLIQWELGVPVVGVVSEEALMPETTLIVGLGLRSWVENHNPMFVTSEGELKKDMVIITLPHSSYSRMNEEKEIFRLGGDGVEGLLSYLGKSRDEVTWSPDGLAFVRTVDYGEDEVAEYYFDIGGGYWASRDDLTASEALTS